MYNTKTSKRLPKYVDKSVIYSMLDNAKEHKMRDYVILNILWKTGLRGSELINIRKCDIRNGCIEVRQGKGDKDRIVPLEENLGNILSLYTDNIGKSDKLFCFTRRQLQNIVHKYQPTGYSVHPHTIRHSFAVFCLLNGLNIRSLQKILGHANLETTAIYLDLIGKDIKDDFSKLTW